MPRKKVSKEVKVLRKKYGYKSPNGGRLQKKGQGFTVNVYMSGENDYKFIIKNTVTNKTMTADYKAVTNMNELMKEVISLANEKLGVDITTEKVAVTPLLPPPPDDTDTEREVAFSSAEYNPDPIIVDFTDTVDPIIVDDYNPEPITIEIEEDEPMNAKEIRFAAPKPEDIPKTEVQQNTDPVYPAPGDAGDDVLYQPIKLEFSADDENTEKKDTSFSDAADIVDTNLALQTNKIEQQPLLAYPSFAKSGQKTSVKQISPAADTLAAEEVDIQLLEEVRKKDGIHDVQQEFGSEPSIVEKGKKFVRKATKGVNKIMYPHMQISPVVLVLVTGLIGYIILRKLNKQ